MAKSEIVHDSWMQLKPYGSDHDSENFQDYLHRIHSLIVFNHIPVEVFEQWIHPLHQNIQTLRNYSWIDFTKVIFELQNWTYEQLLNVNIIPDFQGILDEIDNHLDDVSAIDTDLEVWKNNGTWRVPPIILDVNSLIAHPPGKATITGPYQLIEGHSRYRNLRIMKAKNRPLDATHKIYLMKQ